MYISHIPLICHNRKLVPGHKPCLPPGNHLHTFPLKSYEETVAGPGDIHNHTPLKDRTAHNHVFAQYLLSSGPSGLSAENPAKQALVDRL